MIRALRKEVGDLRTRVDGLHATVHVMQGDHAALKGEVKLNTEVTQQVYENTRTLIEATQTLAALSRATAKWGGRFRRASYSAAKYVAAVALAFSATWAAAKAVFDVNLTKEIVEWWKLR